MALADYYNKVQAYFVASLGRPASSAELAQYAGALEANNGNVWKAGLVTYIQAQPDFSSDVATVYKNLTGAEPTMAIYNYYTGKMLAGEIKAKGLANAMINDLGFMPKADGTYGAPANWAVNLAADAGATDLTGVQNKITVANTFTTSLTTVEQATSYATAEGKASAKTLLAGVTADAATVTTATANVDSTIATIVTDATNTSAVGQTFMLTTSADTGSSFTGTSGNDTFVGVMGTTSTLTAGDYLQGGAGTDSLTVSITGTGVKFTAAGVVMTGVENINVSNYSDDNTADDEINLAQVTGVTAINVTGSADTGDTQFTNVGNLVTASMANGSGDLTIGYTDAAVVGTADTQTLTLSGQTGGAFVATATIGGIETLNIVSNTAANTIDVNGTMTTVNVSGDKNLTLTEAATTIATVNASTLTGNLSYTTNDALAMNVTGGAGNDTITFSTTNFTSADTINGGDGTDTLSLAETAAMTQATFANVTNVEIIKLTADNNAAALTLAANISATSFDLTDTDAQKIEFATGYTNATTVTVGATGADDVVNSANIALTINGKGAAFDVVDLITGGTATDTINLTADATTNTFNLVGQNVTKIDVINVLDGGDTATAATDGTVAGRDASITTGAYATNLTIDASGFDTGASDTDSDGKTGDEATAEQLTVVGTGATGTLNIIGGAGDDTITTGTKNDTVSSGAGDDSITSTAGDESINAGAGDDIINMGGSLTSADTIDGGEGNDTLVVTTLSGAALANVSNIETLKLDSTTAATLSSNISFTTIDLTDQASGDAGAESLTLASGYTAATTVNLDAGDTLVNTGADVVLTVNASAKNLESAYSTTITGSDASGVTNSMNITAQGSDNALANAYIVATSSRITNIDTITVVDNGDAATGATIAGMDLKIDLASYGTALTIDASALDTGTADADADGKFGDDATAEQLIISGTSSKALNVTGGAADDTIVGSSDAAAGDNLNGGAGEDTFTMAGNLSYLDTIDGGSGTDSMTVTGATVDVNFMRVSNVETLSLGTTATLSTYFDASGVTTVNVGTGAVDASGSANGHTFVMTAGVDTITGGLGDDTFVFNETNTLTAADAITAGNGTDTIQIDNTVTNAQAFTATIGLGGVSGVERVTVASANGGDTTGAENADTISITFDGESTAGIDDDNGTDDTNVTMTVDLSNITDTNDTVTVDASDINDFDYSYTMLAGASAATFTGSSGADTLTGGAAADTLKGGVGADVLTGNGGADDFVFDEGDSTSAKTATIADFVAGSDNIVINLVADGTKALNLVDLGDSASNSEALSLLSSKEGEYFFNTTTKQLVMDLNGDGLVQATDMIINLSGATGLSSADVNVNVDATGGAATITTGSGDDVVVIDDTSIGASLVMGSGTDELRIVGTSAHGAITTISGVETLEMTKDATGAAATDVQTLTLTATQKNAFTTINVDGLDNLNIKTLTGATVAGTTAQDTYAFLATDTGVTITSFTSGALATTATAGGDTLDFSSIVTITGTLEGASAAGSGALSALTGAATSSDTNIAGKVFIWSGTTTTLDALIVDEATVGDDVILASGDKAMVLIGTPADGAMTYSVYSVVGATGGTETITLIGTVAVNDGDALVDANFGL